MIINQIINRLRTYRVIIVNRGRVKVGKLEMRKNASIKASPSGIIRIKKLILNENAFLCSSNGGKIEVGTNVSINRNTIIVSKESIKIGDNTSIGPNVCIYDHNHIITGEGFKKEEFSSSPITIGKNVWIGANVTILKGSNIGDNCIIAAGAIVKSTVPADQIVRIIDNTIVEPLRGH